MPVKITHVPPELVLDYKNVKIYRAYLDDDFNHPEEFYFTTSFTETDSAGADSFDVRTLEVTSAGLLESAKPKSVPEYTDKGSPAYQETVEAWDLWYAQVRPTIIINILKEAIDKGILT